MKKAFRYCIAEGSSLGTGKDQTCYEIYDCQADTLCAFLEKMRVCEIDAKGKTVSCTNFHDTPLLVQCAGLTWKDIQECEELPKPAKIRASSARDSDKSSPGHSPAKSAS